MGSRHFLRLFGTTLLATLLATTAWAANNTKLIYSFAGGADGEYTDTELVRDSAGNLYGTSVQGGLYASGTVFQVTPAGVHTVLYNFTGGTDGGEPYKGVTVGPDGSLYGTTVTGGGGSCEGGCGVVFKVTNAAGTWTQTVVHAFLGSDGSGPGSPVAFDRHGNMYGTTPTGGTTYGLGVVYQLEPNSTGWSFHVIHEFTGGADGAGGSASRPLLDTAGRLYGVCTTGGANGLGIVYTLGRPRGQWEFTTIYAFKDSPDGGEPYGGLVFDRFGNLYGSTYYAGTNDAGIVYELTHAQGTWTEQVLYSFTGGADGGSPISSLVMDAAGNLYGTTSAGGSASCGCGVIFKVSHGATGWTESVAYSFLGVPKPGFAYNGMVADGKGSFYGATVHGGTGNDGAIYKFTP